MELYRSYENEYSDFPTKIQFEMPKKLKVQIKKAQTLLKTYPFMRSIKIDAPIMTDKALINYGLGSVDIAVHSDNWWLEVYGKFDSSCYAEYNTEKPDDYEEEE